MEDDFDDNDECDLDDESLERDREIDAYDEMRDREGESFYAMLRSIVERAKCDADIIQGLSDMDSMFVIAPRSKSPYYHNDPLKFWDHVFSQASYEIIDFENKDPAWQAIFDEASKHERLNQ